MLYLASSSAATVRSWMLVPLEPSEGSAVPSSLLLGVMNTPETRYALGRVPDSPWAADNGCFSNKWEEHSWWNWLTSCAPHQDRCLFAVAPDVLHHLEDGSVVGDAPATFELSSSWLPKIRGLGFRAAFVLQDGAMDGLVPWDAFDALFIGGSDELKDGPVGSRFMAEAKARGKWVHMGRVNTDRRLRYAYQEGCDSVDGTFHGFGPDVNTPRMDRYLSEVTQPNLLRELRLSSET